MAEKHDPALCPVCSKLGGTWTHLDTCKNALANKLVRKAREEILTVARELESTGGDLGGLIGIIKESLK